MKIDQNILDPLEFDPWKLERHIFSLFLNTVKIQKYFVDTDKVESFSMKF